mgnify:CR=1 FL=1
MEMPKGSPSDINALLDKEDLKDTFLSLDQIRGTYWYGIFRGSRVSQLFCPSFYLGTKEQKAYGDQAYITHASVIYNNGTYDAYMAVYYSGHDFQQILSENLTLDGSVSYIMNERNNLVSASSDSLRRNLLAGLRQDHGVLHVLQQFRGAGYSGENRLRWFLPDQTARLVYGDGTSLPTPDQSE